jgi:hypothetical protein
LLRQAANLDDLPSLNPVEGYADLTGEWLQRLQAVARRSYDQNPEFDPTEVLLKCHVPIHRHDGIEPGGCRTP